MSSSIDQPLVLVSAVNGYIASWTAKAFLDAGYNVRGTTRSIQSSLALLNGPFKTYADTGRFSIVQVSDITLPGAFDSAIRGCHAVVHTASPMSLNFKDPDSVINIAVSGVKSILNSARDYGGETLKTFVLLSSFAAVKGRPKDEPYTFTESDWDDFSGDEVARLGKTSPSGLIYKASKAAAERVMWDFQSSELLTFKMTAINPVFVWGPPLLFPEDPEDLNITAKVVWTILSGKEIPSPLVASGGCVDVRDVARLILFSVQNVETASGQRYIAAAGVRSEQAVADILRAEYPNRREIIKKGTPFEGYLPDYSFPANSTARIDSSKAVKATGQGWIGPKQSIVDAARVLERYL
ncbi:putative NAD dependent epimerase/dehydratase [Talaromyces proteolyticus]|uniref:NAD dependent epimerase/dehydratase n=1 Tax=Talaromyces proteolyticus TaxID=1131652 RepID=A0AAD4PT46_9EURO|nr:putative NAD dependent epimerase/dehydratase [Talaromyces proteolyticus]KAH8690174.1 putative NAD dependent epimerase/dehydratase [Talaromyces proteolyticus]